MNRIGIGIILGLSILASPVVATEYQSLEEIRSTAETLVKADIGEQSGQRTEVTVGRLDSRLRLQRCDHPLEARRLQNNQRLGNTIVSVSCTGTKPWTVHVPVTVKSFTRVVVASQPLMRQVSLKRSDVRLEERDISTLRSGYFSRIEDVIGRQPKRTLVSGSVLNPYDIETRKIIRRGNKVLIIAETAGIAVRMQGKALGDAGEGELITVENLSSRRKVEAVAVGPGVVKVPM